MSEQLQGGGGGGGGEIVVYIVSYGKYTDL